MEGSEQACEGRCTHDGVCVDGACKCVTGRSGKFCEIGPGMPLLEHDWVRKMVIAILVLIIVGLILIILFVVLKVSY